MEKIKIKYDNIKKHTLKNLTRNGFVIEKLQINDHENIKHFKGNIFLMQLQTAYFHLLYDQIGQYELLKQKIENLKVMFVLGSKEDYQLILENRIPLSLVFKDMFKIYNYNIEDIIYVRDNTSYLFDNVFYFNNSFVNFLQLLDSNVLLYDIEDDDFKNYNLEIVKCLQNVFKNYYQELESKKIFITRKKENEKLKNINNLLINLKNNNINEIKKEDILLLQRYKDTFGNYEYLENLTRTRLQNEKDENDIEMFFINNNYEIVDPSKYGLIDQINLFRNASSVAAVKGTGLANGVFCKNDTQIIMINTHIDYRFWYDSILENTTSKFYEVPIKQKDFDLINFNDINYTFSINNIINKLSLVV